MIITEQIKSAKLIGKYLRKVREEQGFNLAILASKLQFTVVELVAIEDGNLFAFDQSLEKFSEHAQLYSKEMDTNFFDPSHPVEEIKTPTVNDLGISIPHFLRKEG